MSSSLELILVVIGLVALCASTHADAVPEKVHLIFSNHLVSKSPRRVFPSSMHALSVLICHCSQDVGFDGISPVPGTDDNVINKYFTEYFPQAVRVSLFSVLAKG